MVKEIFVMDFGFGEDFGGRKLPSSSSTCVYVCVLSTSKPLLLILFRKIKEKLYIFSTCSHFYDLYFISKSN